MVGKIKIKEEVVADTSFACDATPTTPASDSTCLPNATVAISAAAPTPAAVVTGTKRRAETASEDLEADRDGRISSSSSSGSDAENNQDYKLSLIHISEPTRPY